MRFGAKIRHVLELRGMTQADLAEKSGVSLSMIKALINDKRNVTTTETLEKISQALRVPITYFFDEKKVTPFEVLDHIPPHIQKFILEQDNLDYLELAVDLKDKKLPPSVAKKVIENYEEAIKLLSKARGDYEH